MDRWRKTQSVLSEPEKFLGCKVKRELFGECHRPTQCDQHYLNASKLLLERIDLIILTVMGKIMFFCSG